MFLYQQRRNSAIIVALIVSERCDGNIKSAAVTSNKTILRDYTNNYDAKIKNLVLTKTSYYNLIYTRVASRVYLVSPISEDLFEYLYHRRICLCLRLFGGLYFFLASVLEDFPCDNGIIIIHFLSSNFCERFFLFCLRHRRTCFNSSDIGGLVFVPL